MADIICEDAGHAGRSGDPGWAATLGTSSVENATGYLCQACIAAKLNDVVLVRASIVDAAKATVNAHVAASFSPSAQSSLLALYTEANVTGKANRLAYIQDALDWIQNVLTTYSDYRTAVEAAATANDVRGIELTLPGSAPSVTVTGAIQIPN